MEKRIFEDIESFEEVINAEYKIEETKRLNKLYENIDKCNQFLDDIITDVTINENYTFPLYMAKIEEYLKEINKILNNKTNKEIYESLYDRDNPIKIYAVYYTGPLTYDSYEIRKKT